MKKNLISVSYYNYDNKELVMNTEQHGHDYNDDYSDHELNYI